MLDIIALDFETYCDLSLPDVGLHRYVNHDSFRVLLAATYGHGNSSLVLDFTEDYWGTARELKTLLENRTVVAHNAGFEQAVLDQLEIDIPSHLFVDSAVISRALGFESRLELAGPQILGIDKLASGHAGIKLFSMPQPAPYENWPEDITLKVDRQPEWEEFQRYCQRDAAIAYKIVAQNIDVAQKEQQYAAITMEMNRTGWPVDVPLVEKFYEQYNKNTFNLRQDFETKYEDAPNLASWVQVQNFAKNRKVRMTGTDLQHCMRYETALSKKLLDTTLDVVQRENYEAVLDMLRTKIALGGSALSKLKVILDKTGVDERLYDQYVHIGAQQTWRTTGREVQMQNLKRLSNDIADLENVIDGNWSNSMLAANMRQLFTASTSSGNLIVGDFSSVESRGLAYIAGEIWKLDAYKHNQDLYKVLAGKIYNVAYDDVLKEQRQIGKVGELSCGYNASGPTVVAYAEKMGTHMTEEQGNQLVQDWRELNPEIVGLWNELQMALLRLLSSSSSTGHVQKIHKPYVTIELRRIPAPESLQTQNPNIKFSLRVRVSTNETTPVVTFDRYIHGVHLVGRDVRYYKTATTLNGDLWVSTFQNPKTKQREFYKIYGGKLTGIIVQSFCRELFFQSLKNVYEWAQQYYNIQLIGQFHDEIVLDWLPVGHFPRSNPNGLRTIALADAVTEFTEQMSRTLLSDFPLSAHVEYDYRYLK